MEFEEPIEIHGMPVYFQKVDHLDQKWRDDKIKWLQESKAVKKATHKIKRLEIGTIAGFTFMEEERKFHCKKLDKDTTIEQCRNGYCTYWSEADMMCTEDAIGEYVEEQEPYKQMMVDTMHILRLYFKPKPNQ